MAARKFEHTVDFNKAERKERLGRWQAMWRCFVLLALAYAYKSRCVYENRRIRLTAPNSSIRMFIDVVDRWVRLMYFYWIFSSFNGNFSETDTKNLGFLHDIDSGKYFIIRWLILKISAQFFYSKFRICLYKALQTNHVQSVRQ